MSHALSDCWGERQIRGRCVSVIPLELGVDPDLQSLVAKQGTRNLWVVPGQRTRALGVLVSLVEAVCVSVRAQLRRCQPTLPIRYEAATARRIREDM